MTTKYVILESTGSADIGGWLGPLTINLTPENKKKIKQYNDTVSRFFMLTDSEQTINTMKTMFGYDPEHPSDSVKLIK